MIRKTKGQKLGFVSLVGAGPGDPGLLTLKGKEALERAHVVVMDDLVSPLILTHCPQARVIFVGKRGPGSPQGHYEKKSQEKINSTLIQLARAGHYVVRLKGGDPLLFGRGGEEMEALRQAHVSYDVIPGVSSALAAPAYAGMPLTDRRYSSSVTFITGHESCDVKDHPAGIDWHHLSPNATLSVFMGVSEWATIRQQLLSNSWDPHIGVVAVESATTKFQRVIATTLEKSISDFRAQKLVSPALITVGRVTKMASRLSWVKKQKPLLGQCVVVTRPRAQSLEMKNELSQLGANIIDCPSIEIEPLNLTLTTNQLLNNFRSKKRRGTDWALFLSVNAVETFFSSFSEARDLLNGLSVGAVGPKTAFALNKYGISPKIVASLFNAATLVKQLPMMKNRNVLIPRVQGASQELQRSLEKKGAHVYELETYKTKCAQPPKKIIKSLILSEADFVTFTSASTVKNFFSFFNVAEHKKFLSRVRCISIGHSTSEALKSCGVKKIFQSKQSSSHSIIEKLLSVVTLGK